MRLNDLHPENLPRRLRHQSLRLEDELATCMPSLVAKLRAEAEHLDVLAEIWAKSRADSLHIAIHYHRTARRLRDAAAAIEREHSAGPWICLDQPIVHLSEARPTTAEAQ